ncbi:hypothetical protein Z948_164 [Sulfitobacter donghicola DSW-25 = KCTC 12864 = JCM 14565]|nr:hypothetical protein Z948_164 [Sulfitobacter donghicola DSW-25 = KCTC 12864 = JCM 14565]
MAINNAGTLNALATMSELAYEPTATVGSVSSPTGNYVEIAQIIDGPIGFQARAFFNQTTNDLVIAFSGTEGFPNDAPEFIPDAAAGLVLAVSGVSL